MKKLLYSLMACTLLCPSFMASAAKMPSVSEPQPSALAVPAPATPAATPSFSDALKEFKSLSRSERKDRIREARKELKQFKKDQKEGNAAATTNTLLLVIIAILLPPLAVYLHQGEINSKFWISLILTLLFYIPGLIYSLIVVLGKG